MLGLYIHVPFCSAICNYCNFNRGLFDADLKARYVDALVREIRANPQSRIPNSADTIYFGGGTPSLLEPDEIARIIRACDEAFDVSTDREVTMEANPETVTTARLAAFRAAGVNRLSVGVQSFLDNISLDLMMWLPEQRVSDWLESVDAAIALAPEHLSLYLLEVYPNAPLKDDMARARWSQAPDDDAATMYLEAMSRLEDAGLEQYEISNVARRGCRSRHNLKYWTDGEGLGFGCGAHSTREGSRWKNISSTTDYINVVARGESPAVDIRRLTPAEQLGDALFTGLRLVDGIDTNAIEIRYGVDVWRRFGSELERFLDAGCLQRDKSRLRLTRQGMLLAHEVMTVFV
jgi:oxygen-independent coproporphyrinogen-3 oxidase